MRAAFFKNGRSVILLRDSTTNNGRPGIKVVHTDRCYIIQEKTMQYILIRQSVTDLHMSPMKHACVRACVRHDRLCKKIKII